MAQLSLPKNLFLPEKKRGPTLILLMISGIVFAGFIANKLAAPTGENQYLHEHIRTSLGSSDMIWVGDAGELSGQDRTQITSIIADLDRRDWTAGSEPAVTGQALIAAEKSTCSDISDLCEVTVRVGREFAEEHTNRDHRVTNVTEVSRKVTFDLAPDGTDLTLNEIATETRLLRFYQTQTGWTQKTSEILSTEPLNFSERDGRFSEKFSGGFIGVNYYPASASWKQFWTEFPAAEIESDLEILREMEANSVRIFVNHAYFQDDSRLGDAQAKLRLFLDLCAEKNIAVLVTLFDLRPDYTVSNLAKDIAHIDKVLPGIAKHPAILGVDIKNQADLDFPGWGQGRVKGWLTVMARHIQQTYPDIPVTVGWSQPTAAAGLIDVVDFVTYHEYGNPKGFETRLAGVKARAGDKPVMITELGSTVWTPLRTTKSAEKNQASRLKSQLQQSFAAQGVFVWTLHDFDHVGSEVVGWRPWRKAQQRHFGLIRSDGSARPAKTVFETFAKARTAPATKHAEIPN